MLLVLQARAAILGLYFLNQDAIGVLTAWKKQQKVKSLDGYVFTDDEGNRIQGFKSSWKSIERRQNQKIPIS